MRRFVRSLAIVVCVVVPPVCEAQGADEAEGTFSIVARDPATGELAMAVQSKAFAAGNRAITVKGGLAVIAHQAAANPMYGTLGLELLRAGLTPQQALDQLIRSDEGRDSRQVTILDAQGRTATWTGRGANDWKGHRCGENYCAQGNILVGPGVVDALATSFEGSKGPLAERLLAALDAAQAAGGDARGTQSAALVVTRPLGGAGGFSDRAIDIRVDDARAPLVELRRLLELVRSGEAVGEANRRLAAGDVAGALAAAEAACARAPSNDVAWTTLAATLLRADRRADALDAAHRAIDLNAANRRQLPKQPAFAALADDEGFRRLVAEPGPAPSPRATDADLQRVLADYVGLYARDALARWYALFLPTFSATFTNADGTTTARGLDDFYARQRALFDGGHAVREELRQLRVVRQGPIATATADFTFHDDERSRPGKLSLQLVESGGRFRIASLVFTYHAP